jgi:hypothetical protein
VPKSYPPPDPSRVTPTNPRGLPDDPRATKREDDGPSEAEAAVGKALTDAEALWERIADSAEFKEGAKIPCAECGGVGTMSNGGFGTSPCFNCDGKRVVDDPLADEVVIPMPDFAALRANRQLTLAEAVQVKQDGKDFATRFREQRRLEAAQLQKQLPPAPRESLGSLGADYEDDED